MAEQSSTLETQLEAALDDLNPAGWVRRIAQISAGHGHFQALGKRHFASHIPAGTTLLVTFESLQSARAANAGARPLGWDFVIDEGWSHLGLFSDGDTWFRDPAVHGYFDTLIDDGFFEGFETVVFYGAGAAGYAAAAYSVAAPGARVLALHPQATLDPRVTGWETRFRRKRRIDFTHRYGYAPDMLDAAHRAVVIHDPAEPLDAMHSALFHRPNVTRLRMAHFGPDLQAELVRLGILASLIDAVAEDKLDPLAFGRLMRSRRRDKVHIRRLLAHLEAAGRNDLALRLCRYGADVLGMPKLRRRIAPLEEALRAGREADGAGPEAELAESQTQG